MLDLIFEALFEHCKVLGITHLLLAKIRQSVLSFTLHFLNSLDDSTTGRLVRDLLGLWLGKTQVIILILLGADGGLDEALELAPATDIKPLSVNDGLQTIHNVADLPDAIDSLCKAH